MSIGYVVPSLPADATARREFHGDGVQDLTALSAIVPADRADKQVRLVEDEQVEYRFDQQSVAASNPPTVIVPDDSPGTGRWHIMLTGGGASPLTTKGDLFGFDTGDARIPVGTNGQVLEADSVQAPGVKWATPAASAPASEILAGIAELATQVETDTGTDDTRIVTPLKLAASALSSAVTANTAKVTNANHTGDVTGDTALTIAADAVTFAKMQNITTARMLGRVTGGAGDTEELTAAQVLTLIGVEAGATADQSDAEIETAYNAQVAAASQVEAEAGTEVAIRRFSPLRVAQAIAALETGGGAFTLVDEDTVSGGSVREIDTAAFNGDTNRGPWLFTGRFITGAASMTVSLRLNTSLVVSIRTTHFFDGAVNSAVQGSSPVLANTDAIGDSFSFRIFIPDLHSHGSAQRHVFTEIMTYTASGVQILKGYLDVTTPAISAVITSIGIEGNNVNAWANDSWFKLYHG